ncbi:Putative flippase GtrA (transmembrane translocase of bactoprenol-linked glucose) [Devosia crocina]|uniref:Putative flippase GtrA (Transmembrane translocase of bactoprenol-linked glucose) n=2 Tax=Devosia crocina TaxID=429728 RepID=A0A1I7MW40_9HYPH|nr:Putative flippase GtrA (transmembrane translocase of bactoprenol-linked glucose) [Devosia crocina]
MHYRALSRILPFAFAGAVGFIVDASVLYMSVDLLGPIFGRGLSWCCAVLVTWLINRRLAFADRAASEDLHVEFFRYMVAMVPGGFTNWIGYGLALALVPAGDWQLLIATAVGSLAGMLTNLVMASYVAFSS